MSSLPLDLRNIAKNNFKCFQMGDGSVYYGEVAYIHGADVYERPESAPEDLRHKLSLVRNGYGIQLFGRNEKNELCYYAGEFSNDMKQGKGIFCYPDGSRYEDSFF